MKVTVAESSGFCFGVKNAVKAAEEAVKAPPSGKPLVMLGDIVHNTMVVDSLKKGGFTVAETASEVPEGSFVLIRAHGITPEEKENLEKWFAAGVFCVGMGSKLFPKDKVAAGDWQYVTDKCKEALGYCLGARK